MINSQIKSEHAARQFMGNYLFTHKNPLQTDVNTAIIDNCYIYGR